jgi:hypothetical protein
MLSNILIKKLRAIHFSSSNKLGLRDGSFSLLSVGVFCTGNKQDLQNHTFSISSWSREQEHQ